MAQSAAVFDACEVSSCSSSTCFSDGSSDVELVPIDNVSQDSKPKNSSNIDLAVLKEKLSQAKAKLEQTKAMKAKATTVAKAKTSVVIDGSKKKGVIEMFAGCGRFTAEANSIGLHAVGIDWNHNKDKPEGKCINIDMSTQAGCDLFWQLVADVGAEFVLFAAPCGSSSRAREIPRKGFPGPLRSDDHPDGLPGLAFEDAERVRKANELYKFVAESALELCKRGISWAIENPLNSLFWKTSPMRGLVEMASKLGFDLSDVVFQMCMHGGRRDKKVRLMSFGRVDLSGLSVMCNKEHQHASWTQKGAQGELATAEERRYPKPFCQKLAKLVASVIAPELFTRKDTDAKVGAGLQPRRGCRIGVREHKEVKCFSGCSQLAHDAIQAWKVAGSKATLPWMGIVLGDGAKLLSVEKENGASCGTEVAASYKIEVGLPWNQDEFLKEATKLRHPLDSDVRVAPAVAKVFYECARLGPDEVIARRKGVLKYWLARAMALEKQEEKLHACLNTDVAAAVAGKRILLFKEMLEAIHYDDLEVVGLLSTGIRLVGLLKQVGIWAPKDAGPDCSIQALWWAAPEAQKKLLAHRSPSAEDRAIWEATMDEVADGSLKGPFTKEELDAKHGPRWTGARRFAVVQNDKVRPIDDFSEFMINKAFGLEEKASLAGVNQIVAWARARRAALRGRTMSVPLGVCCPLRFVACTWLFNRIPMHRAPCTSSPHTRRTATMPGPRRASEFVFMFVCEFAEQII